MDDIPDIHAISLRHRIAVLDDGAIVPITHLFDDAGEKTANPEEAFGFVAGPYFGVWFNGRVSSFEQMVWH